MREKQLAIVNEYNAFHRVLRQRAEELKAAQGTLDEVSGMTSGYVAKLLGEGKSRRIGWESLGPLLGALGLKLVLCEDANAMRRYGPRLSKRCEMQVRRARPRAPAEMAQTT